METGYYEPKPCYVTVWPQGADVPDGFVNKFSTTDTEKIDNWVRVDKYNDVIRSEDGQSVAAIAEGGALVEYADGSFKTVTPDEFARFASLLQPVALAEDVPATPVSTDGA